MHTLSSTSATKHATLGDYNLVPLSPYVLSVVYGDNEYVRSVFGRLDITRQELEQYYQRAKGKWHTARLLPTMRTEFSLWQREICLRGLDFYAPLGYDTIWFKNLEDAFAFKLKFGI
jgi:hypothetical protein